MYCHVVKLQVFSLQRGSAKPPIAPSNFSSLCIGRENYCCIPIIELPPRAAECSKEGADSLTFYDLDGFLGWKLSQF